MKKGWTKKDQARIAATSVSLFWLESATRILSDGLIPAKLSSHAYEYVRDTLDQDSYRAWHWNKTDIEQIAALAISETKNRILTEARWQVIRDYLSK